MHSTRHFLKKKSFLNATKLSLQDSNELKVLLSQVRFCSTAPPEQRNPTQVLLDILSNADLNISNKKKGQPMQEPTVSEKQNQADFFGLVLSEKSRETVAARDDDLQDYDAVAGEEFADSKDDFDVYDEEEFDFSELAERYEGIKTPAPAQLSPEADINSRVAVIQEPLTENEERDLAQLVRSVSFDIFDDDKKAMKSIDQVFKLLFKSIESNTKENTCLSGFLPSNHFYLKDLDYGTVVDNDGVEVFCLGLQVSHSYLHKLSTTEFDEYVLYLNRYFQQKFNLKAANLRVKIMSRLGEIKKQSPFEYFNRGKTPASDLKPDFEKNLEMTYLDNSDRQKVDRWFASERFKIQARNHLSEYFYGDGETEASNEKRKPGEYTQAGGFDQFVMIKDVNEATRKAREQKFLNFVQGVEGGEQPSQEEARLLKSNFQSRKINLRSGAAEEPSWLRDNEDDLDVKEPTSNAEEELDSANEGANQNASEVIEYSEVVEVPIIKEEDEINDEAFEEGSMTKAAFQEDGWIDERKEPKPPKGSVEVARGQHQFFCREEFILRFDFYQPTAEYDDQSFLDVRGKNEEEEIDFFVKRERYSQAETRY